MPSYARLKQIQASDPPEVMVISNPGYQLGDGALSKNSAFAHYRHNGLSIRWNAGCNLLQD
jgi:hypothetical protein